MSNLRDYINLVEERPERTDRNGIPYTVTNPPISTPIEPTASNTVTGGNLAAGGPVTNPTPSDPKVSQAPQDPTQGTGMSAMAPEVPSFDQAFPTLAKVAGQPSGAAATTTPATKPAAQAKAKGDPQVRKTQEFLIKNGQNITPDGIWGPETEKAYRAVFPNAPSNKQPNPAAQQGASTTPATAKPDFSKALAAAANPLSAPQSKVSPEQIQAMRDKAAQLTQANDPRAKTYLDWLARNGAGATAQTESSELDRLKSLINFK